MKKAFFLLACLGFLALAADEGFYYFIPPKSWKVVHPEKLPSTIKIAFVANSKKAFKPSLNLGIEKVSVTLPEYIAAVKKQLSSDRKNRWHEVGFLPTKAGKAHISQIDVKAECGDIRSMQAILIQNGTAYVMTAVALREDFLTYHNDFIHAFESFTLCPNALHSLASDALKALYQDKITHLLQDFHKTLAEKKLSPEKAFSHTAFQKGPWKVFEKAISKAFKDQGLVWQVMASKEVKERLIKDI
ncbi:MAG: hypothetical protein FJZ63_00455 [Chlamydiae bacterium]|nr:hypothetical protein [Chlamydiota bacterium]